MNVIEARGLTKAYAGRVVVRDFAMTVAAGDVYGFVGKNGAGKSTVMKMICGDALPTAGEVVLFESDRASAGEGEIYTRSPWRSLKRFWEGRRLAQITPAPGGGRPPGGHCLHGRGAAPKRAGGGLQLLDAHTRRDGRRGL